jgi:hypothetical protein
MATGDGNRVWFPEMIEILRSHWSVGMSFSALIDLCDIVDEMFQRRRPRGEILHRVRSVPDAGVSWVPKVSNDTASAFAQPFCH